MEWWQVLLAALLLVVLLVAPWGLTPWRRWPGEIEVFRGSTDDALRNTRALQRRGLAVNQEVRRLPGGRQEVVLLVSRGDEEKARQALHPGDGSRD
jgi:hypothetical protein